MIIIDDADHPAVERGRYVIGYSESVDGYRHAYADPDSRRGRRHGKVRYSRTPDHPADPRCPECRLERWHTVLVTAACNVEDHGECDAERPVGVECDCICHREPVSEPEG